MCISPSCRIAQQRGISRTANGHLKGGEAALLTHHGYVAATRRPEKPRGQRLTVANPLKMLVGRAGFEPATNGLKGLENQ